MSAGTADQWGQQISGHPASVEAWDEAWEQFLHFRGDPPAEIAGPNADDESFVMGLVFEVTYAVLGGVPLTRQDLVARADAAKHRAPRCTAREAAHVDALNHLVVGDFSTAAEHWDRIARSEPDFAATRFAHDVYLHVGNAEGRLASSTVARAMFADGAGANFIAGQHSFALEEVGRYDEAEQVGLESLAADPDDLWARHALAHVYESTQDNDKAFALLQGSVDRWAQQDLLAAHIWWHLALRLLAVGDIDAVLAIADEQLPSATTPFRLCDQASLLWRVELAGYEAGDRWDALADRWDATTERHACGFIDVHAAMSFARRPEHPGGDRWFTGLEDRPQGSSENDEIFGSVVSPLVEAVRSYAGGDPGRCASIIDQLGASTSRIGGSVAQRDIIRLTRQVAGATT